MAVYDFRQYTLKPGATPEYMAAVRELALPIRQKDRRGVARLLAGHAHRRYWRGCPSARRHAPGAATITAEDDDVVTVPRSTRDEALDLAERLRRPARNLHLHQLVERFPTRERDEPAVRRPRDRR